MLLPAFTTVFQTDLFLFCLIIVGLLALAVGAIFGAIFLCMCIWRLIQMIWYAVTGRWYIIMEQAEQAKEELKNMK